MRVVVEHIPDAGQTVVIDLSKLWAMDAARTALAEIPAPEKAGAVDSLTGSLALEKRGTRVEVGGHVEVRTRRLCARCGEEMELVLDVAPELAYVPTGEEEDSDSEVELEDGDLGVGWYDGVTLNLVDVLCEAVALALPALVSCADTGPCDERTAALLAARGSSGEKTGHPGLQALRRWD